ncbi:hypothetical protein DFJ74DRAFT_687643 [Hyaloraphidium curvatum]|nr:hypothetical protein DFJ74DRAFT_687643 [Hyaloraphidium curvatum]
MRPDPVDHLCRRRRPCLRRRSDRQLRCQREQPRRCLELLERRRHYACQRRRLAVRRPGRAGRPAGQQQRRRCGHRPRRKRDHLWPSGEPVRPCGGVVRLLPERLRRGRRDRRQPRRLPAGLLLPVRAGHRLRQEVPRPFAREPGIDARGVRGQHCAAGLLFAHDSDRWVATLRSIPAELTESASRPHVLQELPQEVDRCVGSRVGFEMGSRG